MRRICACVLILVAGSIAGAQLFPARHVAGVAASAGRGAVLSPAQLATLKTWLTDNASGKDDETAAGLLNAAASPDYWVWRSDVRRVDVYRTTSDAATTWGWTGFKNQGVPEQNAWFEMFMGGQCDFGNQNNRSGALAIFGTTGAGGDNRTHIFAVVRRKASVAEKLYAVAVVSPPANTGNDGVANNRGKTTNPDVLTVEGTITATNVSEARNLP